MIHWDHNATSRLHPDVALLLGERAREGAVGNPSSVHAAGRQARKRLEEARRQLAKEMGCGPKEIVFTASGTEGNALCLKGAFATRPDPKRNRIVTSHIEHPSVHAALEQLERLGAEVVRLAPQSNGRVSEQDLAQALDERVALCSLMWANNETGVLQPVREALKLCRANGILIHTDAVQAVGKVPVRISDLDADFLTFSAHKFGGPAGAAGCVVRRDLSLEPLAPGHQEDGRRGGTPNVAYAEAMALALTRSSESAAAVSERHHALRQKFESELLARFPEVRVNGACADRLPNTSNITFPGVDGEALLIALDLEGICASLGAACASGSLSPSHVLLAMGLSGKDARHSLRFSFGTDVTEAEVNSVLATLTRLVPNCSSV